jgi:capsular exopolysaccharide synthesis family protein
LIEQASPAGTPIAGGSAVRLVAGALVGLFLAALWVFAKESLEDRVRSSDEFTRVAGVPALGQIPYSGIPLDFAEGPNLQPSNQELIEAIRFLQLNIEFAAAGREMRCAVITSATPEEGKSTLSAQLAASIAHSGKSVILVDGDLRLPSVHSIFHLDEGRPGLSNVLIGQRDIDQVLTATGLEGLKIMTAGVRPPDASQLLRSPNLGPVIESLKQRADLVIIDTPPILEVSDTSILASKADGLILVTDSKKTRRKLVREAVRAAQITGRPILGGVLNKTPPRKSAYNYGYGSRYNDAARGRALPSHRMATMLSKIRLVRRASRS